MCVRRNTVPKDIYVRIVYKGGGLVEGTRIFLSNTCLGRFGPPRVTEYNLVATLTGEGGL